MDRLSVQRFGFDEAVVSLNCEDKEINRFTESYLGPFFPPKNVKLSNWSLEVSTSESAWIKARDMHLNLCKSHPTTVLITPSIDWCELPEGFVSVHQSDPDTIGPSFFWTINIASRISTLAVVPQHIESRYMVARLVRSILMFEALTRGWTQYHGSCFAIGNAGVLVLGIKGAGKTTFLLEALSSFGADYVTNDRALVRFQKGGCHACGLPHSPAIRKELISNYGLEEQSTHYYFQTKPEKKWRFHCIDICAKFGCQIVTEIDIRAIIFPQYNSSKQSILKLDEDETRRRLEFFKLLKMCAFQPLWDHFTCTHELVSHVTLPIAYQVLFNEKNVMNILSRVVDECC